MGNTAIETTLKASITLMKEGNINERKSLILKKAYSKPNNYYGCTGDGKYDCYGSENSACAFLCLFSHIRMENESWTKVHIIILSK